MIKRVCMVYVSERMSDCRGVGGRMYDVECREVRCGSIGSGGVISHTATSKVWIMPVAYTKTIFCRLQVDNPRVQ